MGKYLLILTPFMSQLKKTQRSLCSPSQPCGTLQQRGCSFIHHFTFSFLISVATPALRDTETCSADECLKNRWKDQISGCNLTFSPILDIRMSSLNNSFINTGHTKVLRINTVQWGSHKPVLGLGPGPSPVAMTKYWCSSSRWRKSPCSSVNLSEWLHPYSGWMLNTHFPTLAS